MDGVDGLGARPELGRASARSTRWCRRRWPPRPGRGPWSGPRGRRGRDRCTSAVMSSGVSAIGSTRPRAPSSRPTQSRAATWSPSCSQRLTISRLPTTWPFISPVPAKRCWSTLAQVSPHSSSPHSAASAIRRSPGGSTPNSERSRPDEPPSSATVTTAVRSTGSRRRADRDAYRPCPPPSAVDPAGRGRSAHSRPRSRWTGITSYPASRSCRDISSVIATLRCLPPVQPMATDMNRLPSRR